MRASLPPPGQLLSSWKLSIALMAAGALYYAFLAIFATMTPAQIIANIATQISFWTLYALILLNTVVCIWRRIPALVREIGRTPLADRTRARWQQALPPDTTEAEVQARLGELGYRCTTRTPGLLGVRRRWGALGTMIFHGSFLVVATGFLLTFLYRAEHKISVAVGEQFSTDATERRYPSALERVAPFTVNAITPEFWQGEFLFTSLTADVTLADGDYAQTKINRPLWLGWGTFLRLSNFGWAPEYELVDRTDRVVEAGVVKLGLIPPGQRDHFPLTTVPHRVFVQVYPNAEVRGDEVANRTMDLIDPVIAVRVVREKLVISQGLLRLGQELEFEGLRVRFSNIRYFGEFAALSDPGAPLLLLGFLVGFAGLVLRAGGRRGEIAWTPGDGGHGGALLGYGTAAQPESEEVEARPAPAVRAEPVEARSGTPDPEEASS